MGEATGKLAFQFTCASPNRAKYAGPRVLTWTTPPVEYEEVVTITTEPPGCRVYCQDKLVGISPLTIQNDGGNARLHERSGWDLFVKYIWKPEQEGTWSIQAFKDGHQSAARTVPCGDEVFHQAFAAVDYQNPPKKVTGNRSVLLALQPMPGNAAPAVQNTSQTPPATAAVAPPSQPVSGPSGHLSVELA